MLSGISHVAFPAVIRLMAGLIALSPPPTGRLPLRIVESRPREVSTDIEVQLKQAAALEQDGSPLEAARLYRTILIHLDADQAQARRALTRLAGSTALPDTAGNESLIKARLGADFRRLLTPHFVIFTNAEVKWTDRQITRLERTYDEFFRWGQSLFRRPLPLTERLVCVLFDDAAGFQKYAQDFDHITPEWVAGYYASEPNCVVFYDNTNGPMMAQANRDLARAKKQAVDLKARARQARLARKAERARELESAAGRLEEQIADESQRLVGVADAAATAKTVHEAIHQLSFNTHVQTRYRLYPFWINEGLATAFETASVNQAFGPGHDSPDRRRRAAQLLSEDAFMPLRDLLALEEVADGQAKTADTMYHQSYALVTWLARFRSEELNRYLATMAQPIGVDGALPSPRLTRAEHIRAFAGAFGSIDRVEREWLAWLRQRDDPDSDPKD